MTIVTRCPVCDKQETKVLSKEDTRKIMQRMYIGNEYNTLFINRTCPKCKIEIMNSVYQNIKYTNGKEDKLSIKGHIISVLYTFGYIEIKYRTPDYDVRVLRQAKHKGFVLVIY